jgi:DNA-binding winged helix-turn-helix (wHTH) protein/tetratricopeptide (TPR) repeat protein|tara:strand:+ start:1894 stop:3438 length:1545 start_codon:yes stop_codon:yes gene_type:complete
MNAFEFGEWKCDPKSLTIKSKGAVVKLELKVMTVLQILAAKAPNVVSQDELMTAAWPGVIVSDGAIYRVIALLRRAMNDRKKPHKYIESIPRVGYRLKHKINIEKDKVPQLSPKERQRRISLTIATKGKNNHPCLEESITMIERHVSWNSPTFSIQRRRAVEQSDYQVEISLSKNEKDIELQWQIFCKEENELVYSGLHNETRLSSEPLPPRVAELVAESISKQSLRHRHKEIGDTSDLRYLNYWDLINFGERFVSMHTEQIELRRKSLNYVVKMAPAIAVGHSALGKLLSWEVINGVAKNTKQNINLAIECAARAIDIDPNAPYVTSSCGLINSRMGKHNLGIELCRQTLSTAPSAHAKDALAMSLSFAGKPDEAIDLYLQVFASMPAGQIFHFGKLVLPLVQSGQIERALEYADLGTIYLPGDFFSWLLRCNVSAQLGNLDGAKADLIQAQKLMPSLNLLNIISNIERNYGRTESQKRCLTSGYKRLLNDNSGKYTDPEKPYLTHQEQLRTH